MSAPRFTAEQRAAIEDRSGSSLLAANAGSGKTAVMVERFVEAVLLDGVPVGSILALTFTEKAAGELRERARKRLHDLGEDEHARAVDAAWIGTIHGFCARGCARGRSPRGWTRASRCSRRPPPGRLAAAAYERALEAWVAALGRPAVDLAAAYGPGLRDLVLARARHAALARRGAAARDPGRSGPRRPRPRWPRRARSRRRSWRAPATASASARAAARSTRAPAPRRARGAARPCRRRASSTRRSSARGRRRSPRPRARPTGPPGRPTARAAPTTTRARRGDPARRAAGALRARVRGRQGRARGGRLRGPRARRARPARRRGRAAALERALRAADGRRVPGHQPAPARPARGARAGQPVRGRRRVPVDLPLPPRRRADLPRAAGQARRRAGARAAGQLPLGARAAGRARRRLRAGVRRGVPAARGGPPARRGARGRRTPASCGCSTPTRPRARRPSSCWSRRRRPGTSTRARSGSARSPSSRGAAPRRAWSRTACARRSAPAAAPATSSCSCARPRRCGCSSRRSRSRACRPTSSAAAATGPRSRSATASPTSARSPTRATRPPSTASLASPFCGAGSDALVLLAQAGREGAAGPGRRACAAASPPRAARWARPPWRPPGGPPPGRRPRGAPTDAWLDAVPAADREKLVRFARFFGAERARAERLPPEALLERAITATGYDLAILARAGGERRLANLRKLMRLAREYEHSEGRDLRGFLDFAATQDLAEAREGEAALESDGLDAVRLMTIHRAKGLEFPVVCVADLGRLGAGGRPRLLIGDDGAVGLRLAPLGGGDAVPALAYDRLAAEEDPADAEEERRLLYVAMTRARETLILSGGTDVERWPEPRPGGAPLDWIVRAIARRSARAVRARRPTTCSSAPGTAAPPACAARSTRPPRSAPCCRARRSPRGAPRARRARDRAAEGAEGDARAARARAARAAAALLHRAAGVRALRLPLLPPARARPPDEPPPPPLEAPEEERAGLDPLVRGGLAHALLETIDFARPEPPGRRGRRRARRPPRRRRSPARTSRTCGRSSARSRARRCASGSPPPPRSGARPASRSRSSRAAAARSSTASST